MEPAHCLESKYATAADILKDSSFNDPASRLSQRLAAISASDMSTRTGETFSGPPPCTSGEQQNPTPGRSIGGLGGSVPAAGEGLDPPRPQRLGAQRRDAERSAQQRHFEAMTAELARRKEVSERAGQLYCCCVLIRSCIYHDFLSS